LGYFSCHLVVLSSSFLLALKVTYGFSKIVKVEEGGTGQSSFLYKGVPHYAMLRSAGRRRGYDGVNAYHRMIEAFGRLMEGRVCKLAAGFVVALVHVKLGALGRDLSSVMELLI
jgi:hypothetical protein